MKMWNDQRSTIATMVSVNFMLGIVNALVKKTLDGGISHMVIATYRLAISTLFLAPFAYFYDRETRQEMTTSILCQLFLSALLGASLTQYFFLLGLSYTSATLACAFLSMMPAITFIMALIFRLEKLNMKTKAGYAKVFGTLICIGGALFLTFYKGIPLSSDHHSQSKAEIHHNTEKKKENWVVGSLLLLAGSTFFSSWLLVQARINRTYPCQYSSTVVLSFFGTLQSALLSLIQHRTVSAWIVKDTFSILTILYAGAVGQGICTVGMSWCIKKRGPVFTSTFTPLTLIFATLFDFAVLHRRIYLGSVLGSVFVILGLYVFLWGKSNDIEVLVPVSTSHVSEEKDEELQEVNRIGATSACTSDS